MAQRPVDAGRSLVFPLSQAIFPHVSRLSIESPEEATQFMRRHTRTLILPFIVVSAGLFAGAFVIMEILGGHRYGPSVPLMRIMSPIPVIVSVSAIYATQYMLGMGFKKEWSRLIISAGAFNFVVLLPLLLLMKATYAVAITSVAGEAWVSAGAYLFFRYKLRHPTITQATDAAVK
jgi:PST family polysaccharide transporter